MQFVRLSSIFTIVIAIMFPAVSVGSIVEVGGLNIINDPTNPSHGLRYLDMSFSTDDNIDFPNAARIGLTEGDALLKAKMTYPNARLATPDEFVDLFAAAGVILQTGRSVLDAFATGGDYSISNSTANTAIADLIAILGPTFPDNTNIPNSPSVVIWTDPDGAAGTRDYLTLNSVPAAGTGQQAGIKKNGFGWLLVSDPIEGAVPEASSILTWIGLGMIGCVVGLRKSWR